MIVSLWQANVEAKIAELTKENQVSPRRERRTGRVIKHGYRYIIYACMCIYVYMCVYMPTLKTWVIRILTGGHDLEGQRL